MVSNTIKNTVIAGCIGLVGLFSTSLHAVGHSTDFISSFGTIAPEASPGATDMVVTSGVAGGFMTGGDGYFSHRYTFDINPGVVQPMAGSVTLNGVWSDFEFITTRLYATVGGVDQEDIFGFEEPVGDEYGNIETMFFIDEPIYKDEGYYNFVVEGLVSGMIGGAYMLAAGGMSPVPLPAAAWLFISGFLALGGMSFFKRKREEKNSLPSGGLTA